MLLRDPENATVEVELPEDFDEFWAAGLADCASYLLDPVLTEMPALSTDQVIVYDLRYTSYGGLLIAGSHAATASLAAITLAAGVGALYISQSSYWSVTADIAGRNAGVVSSIMNTGAQVGGAVTTTLSPWLAQQFGWSASFLAAALLAFAGALAWLGVNPEIPLSISAQLPESAAETIIPAG